MCVNGRDTPESVSDAETTQTHRMVVKLKMHFCLRTLADEG